MFWTGGKSRPRWDSIADLPAIPTELTGPRFVDLEFFKSLMLPFRSALRGRGKNKEEKKKRRKSVSDKQCSYDVGGTANSSS